ncbi:MAG: Ig-like domain-containing protein, partial [Pseudomonadota bacterium]
MLIRFFSTWLMLILMLGLLTACGGGDDDSSGLLPSSGDEQPGNGNTGENNAAAVRSITLLASLTQQIANGTEQITITVIVRDNANIPLSGVPVTVFATGATANTAIFDKGTAESNEGGTAIFKVSNTVAGAVTVNATAGRIKESIDVSFVSAIPDDIRLSLNVFDNGQVANGEDAVRVDVVARNGAGNAVEGVPITVRMQGVAVAAPSQSNTDANGFFSTNITSTLAGDFKVTIAVDGTSIPSQEVIVTFVESTDVGVFNDIQLSVNVVNDQQPANGQDAIQIDVVVRDKTGQAVKDVPIVVLMPQNSVAVANPSQDKTNANGFFSTQITSTADGNVKVSIGVKGSSIRPKEVTITFLAPESNDLIEVANILLITNSTQLGSEGNSDGVIITAIVKNKENNLVEDAEVSFHADSGELRPIKIEGSTAPAGVTDVSGRAQARLTTQVSSDNRTITVTAKVATKSGGTLEDSISIDVIGTNISIAGPTSVVINTEASFVISLKDSADKGIAGKALSLSSQLNNTFNPPSPVTNVQGQAEVIYTASHAGEDVITASRAGADEDSIQVSISDSNFIITPISSSNNLCTLISDNEDINNNRILDAGEDINGNGRLDFGCQVPLNLSGGQGFNVHWDEGGVAQVNEKITLSTTRGTLDNNAITTNANGEASFTVSPSGDAGNSIITVVAERAGGPSEQFNLKFVATNANSITVQANPAVIGVNPV